MKHQEKKIWFVDHPLNQFKENVKDLAARNQLRIVDSKFQHNFKPELVAGDTPKLTKKGAKVIEKENVAAKIEEQKPIVITED